jgi:hypothetical protein
VIETRHESAVGRHPYYPYNTADWTGSGGKSLDVADEPDAKVLVGPYKRNFTIFEGTSEIQHLVIARAISGLHIE